MTADPRHEPPQVADERATLTGFLQRQRDTLALKCAGLTPAQLRERAIDPSGLSLLGLVRHLTLVERSWFRAVVNGEDCKPLWDRPDFGELEFDPDGAEPGEAFAAWRAECAHSRAVVAAAESLDALGYHNADPFSLRYVLTHMIEEYARHNGHADLIRERLDGTTGE
ncbi:DinB family protein [Actinoplanes sp. NPDC049599]|uniref:DinB family protein n=1 Tax=Actinoplanes sp. NPDC049599 TaxID=3363903 RepID=UPI003787E5AD